MTTSYTLPTDKLAVEQGCYFDDDAAERVRYFFKSFLRHSKGKWAGKSFDLLDWQWHNLIRPLYGWKRPDGTRRFRSAYVEIPKKNGKSTLSAGQALYLLIGDREPGAEVYAAAADRDQASIVYNEAANMVDASPALSSKLVVRRSTKRIHYPNSQSIFRALSAEAKTKEGFNIHGLIFDELHAQPNRELWDTLAYGGASRDQPLSISITTAGYDRTSICWEQREYGKSVLEGRSDDISFFPLIYGAEPEDDWTDPKIWSKANPSMGKTIREDEMEKACKEAQQSPAKENAFKRYRLNIWTEQATR